MPDIHHMLVTPREGRVSRNRPHCKNHAEHYVTPREGRVSRNGIDEQARHYGLVTPREGRVSRNDGVVDGDAGVEGHAPRGACE